MSALLRFAQSRHRLSAAGQAVDDQLMLEAERRTVSGIWALDIVGHVPRGEYGLALTYIASGPPRIEMAQSSNVAYARSRQLGPPALQTVADRAFVAVESMTAATVRVMTTTLPLVVASLEASLACAAPPTRGVHA